MRLFSFRACVLTSTALVLLSFSRPAAASDDSFCPNCAAAIVGAAVGAGVLIGVGIYFIHHAHTSVKGCVQQTDNGLSLTAKDGSVYSLVNAPNEVKARERYSLRGHKSKSASGRTFRVNHVSRDYGACSP
jgi:hypothetical protein